MYSSFRPRNRYSNVVIFSELAFTANTKADGGVGGAVLTTLPLNWSVGSAAVASFLLKSYATSLTGSLLSLCVVASSRFELSSRLLRKSWFPQQPPVPVHLSLLSLLLAILLPSVTQARSTPVRAYEIGMRRLLPNNAGKTHFISVI